MQSIILDFSECKYLSEIHSILKAKFDFPEYYGGNLSALWDCLDGYCENNLYVYINGFYKLPKEMDEYKEKMWEIFCRVSKHNPNMHFEILS